jgi:LPXTG-site transpeptidase (sortase) family protein
MSRYIVLILALSLIGCALIGCADVVATPDPVEDPGPMKQRPEPEEEFVHPLKEKQYTLYTRYQRYYVERDVIPDEIVIDNFKVARLLMPSSRIGIDCFVYAGELESLDDEHYLELGAVQLYSDQTSNPGTIPGNTNIGSHVEEYFWRLDFARSNDDIYLDVNGYRFHYQVCDKLYTDDLDWSMILDNPDYPAITLQTCNHHADGTVGRLYVRGELIDVTPAPALP